jgi:stearoyl-CoA desaturase (delta-9 desaturase)
LESENSARNIASRKNSWHHPDEKINWTGSAGFLLVHVAGIFAFLTGVSWAAIAMCFFMYGLRMFAVTGGYHRYFSHRSYKTSRWFQFVLAFLACSSGQKGVLWWAAHHRHHHKYSDTPEDIHSPILRGFWWAHVGWVLCKKYNPTREENVKDLLIYPELRWLNRNDGIAPFTLAAAIFGFGELLRIYAPGLHTNGLQMIAWGFFTSTVLLYHGTFFINSLTHMIGRQRFKTDDYSKNSLILAIITMGEGWHNNHHRYPYAESQGIYWWELDITHGILKTLSWVGLIWDLQKHPPEVFQKKVHF